jgi:hypothetical protein
MHIATLHELLNKRKKLTFESQMKHNPIKLHQKCHMIVIAFCIIQKNSILIYMEIFAQLSFFWMMGNFLFSVQEFFDLVF